MDAASCDIHKVVRYDYADELQSDLAREAIMEWQKEEWKGIYNGEAVSDTLRNLEYTIPSNHREVLDDRSKADGLVSAVLCPQDRIPFESSQSSIILSVTRYA